MKYIDNPDRMLLEILKKTYLVAILPLFYSLIYDLEIFLGLIFGLLISTLLLRLKLLHIKRSLNMGKGKANSFIRNRYFVEYGICLIVLVVAFNNPSVNFLAAAIGLFLMKITVAGWMVLELIKNGWENQLDKYR